MGLLSNLVLLTAASLVAADPATPRISSISFSGNGCPDNAKYTGNFNNACFTFSDFAGSAPGSNSTLNCQVHLVGTAATPGWQVSLKSSVTKGHVVLAPGTTLTHYTTSYFSQDAAVTDTITTSVANNGDNTINKAVTIVSNADATRAWSPCTGSDGSTGIFNINFRGALTGGAKAWFEIDSEEWDLEWRRC